MVYGVEDRWMEFWIWDGASESGCGRKGRVTYRAGRETSHEMRCADDEVVEHPLNGVAWRDALGDRAGL